MISRTSTLHNLSENCQTAIRASGRDVLLAVSGSCPVQCLFCVWAHGSVSVCVCHVLPLSHLPVSPGHAPLFSPRLLDCVHLILVCSELYIVFLSLVSWLVRFGVYLFLGLRVKLWSCSSDFLISYLVIWYPCFLFVFSSSCFFDFVHISSSFVFAFYLDFLLPFAVPVPFWILAFCFVSLIVYLLFLSVCVLVLSCLLWCPVLYPDSLTSDPCYLEAALHSHESSLWFCESVPGS